jgi:hypothetical protein
VDKDWLQQREAEVKAFQTRCRTAVACVAEAQRALTTVAHGLPAVTVHEGTLSRRPRSGKQGRPGQDAAPVQVV